MSLLLHGCMPKVICFDRWVQGRVEFFLDYPWCLYAALLLFWMFFAWRNKHYEYESLVADQLAQRGNVLLCLLLASWQLVVPCILHVAWEWSLLAWVVHSLVIWCVRGAFAAHLCALYHWVIFIKWVLRCFWRARYTETELKRIVTQPLQQLNEHERAAWQQYQVSLGHIVHNRPRQAVRLDYIDLLQWYTRIDANIRMVEDEITNMIAAMNQDVTDDVNLLQLQTKLNKAVESEPILRSAKTTLYTIEFVIWLPSAPVMILFIYLAGYLAHGWSLWSQTCMQQRMAHAYQQRFPRA